MFCKEKNHKRLALCKNNWYIKNVKWVIQRTKVHVGSLNSPKNETN